VRFENLGRLDAAGGEVGDELGVGGEEIVLAQFFGEDPEELFERARGEFGFANLGGVKEDFELLGSSCVFVDYASDGRALYQGCGKFFFQLASEGLLGAFARFDFSAGEFPLKRGCVIVTALADQKTAVRPLNYGCYDNSHGAGPLSVSWDISQHG